MNSTDLIDVHNMFQLLYVEFKQKKIFALNKKYNVDMFSTAVRGGKAFAAEQKLRELKKRLSRLLVLHTKKQQDKAQITKTY